MDAKQPVRQNAVEHMPKTSTHQGRCEQPAAASGLRQCSTATNESYKASTCHDVHQRVEQPIEKHLIADAIDQTQEMMPLEDLVQQDSVKKPA
ncbi:MAG: hypothetical protein K0S66_2272 [Sphingomonas sp.]|nr:hypothetical protein [Sphingomonas sp.]